MKHNNVGSGNSRGNVASQEFMLVVTRGGA